MPPAIRISALVLLAIFAVATCFDADAQMPGSSSTHEQPTTYLFDNHRFEIPKSLIEDYPPDHSTIALHAMLPDFRPIDLACGKKVPAINGFTLFYQLRLFLRYQSNAAGCS